jgi:3-hydroxyisobutyrate dehydrogenase
VNTVGIIGAGAMGMAMALNLAAKGHRVIVRDVAAQVQAQARAAGMVVCASPRDLAQRCEIVLVVVVDAQQIEDVLFGPHGVVHAQAGARTVLLASTIAPQDSARLADELSRRGWAAIEGPISGGPARARAGTMSMMLAAPDPLLAHWQPLLDDLAAKRFVVGAQIGDAAKAKLVNNLLAGTNLVAAAEALALSEKVGLAPRAMFDIIAASSGASWIFEDRMPRALEEAFLPALAAARILTKDLGLATSLAESVGQPTPLGLAALAKFRETVQRGWGELDDSAVIKAYRAEP